MVKTVFKLFSDPQLAGEAIANLRGSAGAAAVGVLVRSGGGAEGLAASLHSDAKEVGTVQDVGPVVVVGADVFGVAGGKPGDDASQSVAAALGLPVEALGAFALGLLRGGALVAVRGEAEALVVARKVLREVEDEPSRSTREANDGFSLSDRKTSSRPEDAQHSGR